MKKRWLVCTLLLIAALALLTTGALANSSAIPTLDVTADASGEGWSWDASKTTLTLENADIHAEGDVFYIDADDAVVELKGENKLRALDNGADYPYECSVIECEGNLTITGDGSLTITSAGDGICSSDMIIMDTVVTIEEASTPIMCGGEHLKVTNSKLKIKEVEYGIWAECNCEIADSEVEINRTEDTGLSVGWELVISDSIFRVESSKTAALEAWDCKVSVENSEVYLNSDLMAFWGGTYYGEQFKSDAPIRAGEDADNLKSVKLEWCPKDQYSINDYYTFLANGKPAKTVVIGDGNVRSDDVAFIPAIAGRRISFSDVTAQTEYYDAITQAYNRGLMGGVSATQFAPDATLTRAMVWTVLARANGVNTEIGATWDSAGRDWAMREKISDGTNPSGAVTVEELVTMAWRNVGSPYRVADLGNADVSAWATEAMRWAYETGILSRRIDPKSNATRALTAHVLTAK